MDMALASYQVVYTDFLDPYEEALATSLLIQAPDLEGRASGAYPQAERKILALGPEFLPFRPQDGLALIGIQSQARDLAHREVLGSVLGLGLDRRVVGDIITQGTQAWLVIKKELKDFILLELTRVGSTPVISKEVPLEGFDPPPTIYKEARATVSSDRLDGLVSACFKLSRKEAKALVQAGQVKVDFRRERRPGYSVSEDSLISVRGHGRRVFDSILGKSKKDRLHILYKTPVD